MVGTFNGWEDMPEQERELLETWEEEDSPCGGVLTAETPPPFINQSC